VYSVTPYSLSGGVLAVKTLGDPPQENSRRVPRGGWASLGPLVLLGPCVWGGRLQVACPANWLSRHNPLGALTKDCQVDPFTFLEVAWCSFVPHCRGKAEGLTNSLFQLQACPQPFKPSRHPPSFLFFCPSSEKFRSGSSESIFMTQNCCWGGVCTGLALCLATSSPAWLHMQHCIAK
jgi:hypothetical protein